MDKFNKKKLCTVCMYPIVFKKDAYWKPAANGKTYPLNIHYKDCATKVYINGENAWAESKRNVTKVQQLNIMYR